jgi:hypothetical protein
LQIVVWRPRRDGSDHGVRVDARIIVFVVDIGTANDNLLDSRSVG